MNDPLAAILAKSLDALDQGKMTVEETLARIPKHQTELVELLEVADFIRKAHNEPADLAYRFKSRASLLNKVISYGPVTFLDRFSLWFQETINIEKRKTVMPFILLVTVLLSLLGGGSVFASEYSVPGDILYPMKLLVEEVRLAYSGEQQDAELYLQFAETRLREVDTLTEKGRFKGIEVALERFENQVEGAARLRQNNASFEEDWMQTKPAELNQHLDKHIDVLNGLFETVSPEAYSAIELAIQASSKGQSKLNQLFPEGLPFGPPGDTSELPGLPIEPPDTDSPGRPENVPAGPPDSVEQPAMEYPTTEVPEVPPAGVPPVATESPPNSSNDLSPTPPVSPPAGRP